MRFCGGQWRNWGRGGHARYLSTATISCLKARHSLFSSSTIHVLLMRFNFTVSWTHGYLLFLEKGKWSRREREREGFPTSLPPPLFHPSNRSTAHVSYLYSMYSFFTHDLSMAKFASLTYQVSVPFYKLFYCTFLLVYLTCLRKHG